MTRPPKAKRVVPLCPGSKIMVGLQEMLDGKYMSIDGLYDDGRLVATGDRPADWYRAASDPGRGSDR